MAAKYWIKLYHEVLHDRKMAQLGDRLWRRAIEIFLLAGEYDQRGFLPAIDDMAWTLRTDPEFLETELRELSNVGIVEQKNGGWFVVKFADRQGTMDKAEYMRRLRKERQAEEHYQDDTNGLPVSDQPVTNGNTDEIREDKDTDKNQKSGDGGDFAIVISAYENNIGGLNEIISGLIGEAVDTYPVDWILDAIEIAVKNNSLKWNYVEGVLKNWQTKGRGYSPKVSKNGKPDPAADPYFDDIKPVGGLY